ncbi:hypothetical protein Mgra_00006901 [Meloidogyne graminicola]|uniref:Uncharacterized protein n=1 Tax=Meloidogyne graminicola TaxID=189291 RepID=A0A8S9ZK28_9BILA|nr:hypothetical protein Mgra_00006901 [Meloidogyne graminicola]
MFGARRRNSLRGDYREVRRFRNRREYSAWWDTGEVNNWRINSRHPSRHGTVEYWRCAFAVGRFFTCPSRVRITFGFGDRFVIVASARNHPHNHNRVTNTDNNPNIVRRVTPMEASPLQTARTVHIGPRPSTSAPNQSTTSGAKDQASAPKTSGSTTSAIATPANSAPNQSTTSGAKDQASAPKTSGSTTSAIATPLKPPGFALAAGTNVSLYIS